MPRRPDANQLAGITDWRGTSRGAHRFLEVVVFRPVVGVATLTLMLAFLFLVEGVLDFML